MFEQPYLFFSVGHCGPLYNRSNDSLRTDSGNESSKHVRFFFPSARDVCIADKVVCWVCLPFVKMVGETFLGHEGINTPSSPHQNIYRLTRNS